MSRDLVMPTLNCPFPRREHPGAADAEKAALAWLTTRGIPVGSSQLGVHLASLFGAFAAMTYPDVAPDRLALAAKWLGWLFVFDDLHLDENPGAVNATAMANVMIPTLAVLTPPHIPPTQAAARGPERDPLSRALQELLEEFARCGTPTQMRRLTDDLALALFSAHLEAGAWTAARRVPDLAEYRITRQHSGAVFPCLTLIDILSGYEVPSHEFHHPQVQALRGSASNVITWSNDLFSSVKEARRSEFAINLPTVLRHHGHSAQEALDHTARLHNEEVDTYLELEAQALNWASPELRRYLDGLRAWMQGNHYWSLESGRYDLTATQVAELLGRPQTILEGPPHHA
ncbi:terpene synthase family protein [Kitasatospora sp. NPDC001095]